MLGVIEDDAFCLYDCYNWTCFDFRHPRDFTMYMLYIVALCNFQWQRIQNNINNDNNNNNENDNNDNSNDNTNCYHFCYYYCYYYYYNYYHYYQNNNDIDDNAALCFVLTTII